MNNILTLDQMQNMSTDDTINAYNNGYRLSDKTEIYSSLQLTQSDISTIVTANVISNMITIVLFGGVIWYIIRKEREKFVSEIKQTITSGIQTGLVKLPAVLKELKELGIIK